MSSPKFGPSAPLRAPLIEPTRGPLIPLKLPSPAILARLDVDPYNWSASLELLRCKAFIPLKPSAVWELSRGTKPRRSWLRLADKLLDLRLPLRSLKPQGWSDNLDPRGCKALTPDRLWEEPSMSPSPELIDARDALDWMLPRRRSLRFWGEDQVECKRWARLAETLPLDMTQAS